MDVHEFSILEMVENKSKLKHKKSIIKETTFINKVINSLLYCKPIIHPIGDDELRIRERNNIRIIVNLFHEECLSYDEDNVTDDELTKIHRLKSQSSLVYFTSLIKKACEHKFVMPGDSELFTKIELNQNKDYRKKIT